MHIARRTHIPCCLHSDREDGHHKIIVDRHNLLEDSTEKFMSKKASDVSIFLRLPSLNHRTIHKIVYVCVRQFRMIFRFKFRNEPALDAGGVAREWSVCSNFN